MKINIKGKDVELRYSMRSLIMFENITSKTFNPQTTLDVMIYFLCVLLASDKTLQLTLDELIDIVDEDPKKLEAFSNWLTGEINKQNLLSQDTHVEVDDEKKA